MNCPSMAAFKVPADNYKSASEILIISLQNNPKDISSRELLVKCYDMNESWNKAIEQLKILNTFNSSLKYESQLAMFLALNEDYIESKAIMTKLENELSVLFVAKEKEYEESAIKIKSLLKVEGDSTKQELLRSKLESLYEQHENVKQSVVDSLHLQNVLIAEALYYLSSDRTSAADKIKECIERDSFNLRYFEKSVLRKISSTEKPTPNLGNIHSFNTKIIAYHSQRANLYASIGYVDEAIENFMDELYWFDSQEKKYSKLSIDLKYYNVIDYLNKCNHFEDAIELYNRLKSTYKIQTQLCDAKIKYTKLMMQKKTK